MNRPLHIYHLLLALLLGACSIASSCAQEPKPPFWDEIEAFKEQDREQMPPPGALLFVGSSSIRLWNSLADDFPAHQVINRGFGGSTLPDLEYYLPDIVLPYKPRQIIIYSGENDIASGKVSAEELLARFDRIFTAIRQEMPQVPILYISMKPSPSRLQFQPLLQTANALLQDYLSQQPHTAWVDVFTPMLDESGQPRPELFIEDQLHMNEEGYRIWAEKVERYLLSE
jgi:lysophospholipase L1-like esterase